MPATDGTATAAPGGDPLAVAITAALGMGAITVSARGLRLPAIKAGLGAGTAAIGLVLAGVTVGAIFGRLASTSVLAWRGGRAVGAAAGSGIGAACAACPASSGFAAG
jgi:hypothetical protein